MEGLEKLVPRASCDGERPGTSGGGLARRSVPSDERWAPAPSSGPTPYGEGPVEEGIRFRKHFRRCFKGLWKGNVAT